MSNKKMKIKRSKYRLYKKRKSTSRKVAETIGLIVLIGGLGFLGYCVADPVISYFKGLKGDVPEVTEWTPEITTVAEDTTEETGTTPAEETTTTEAAKTEPLAYYLPDSALDSAGNLGSAVSSARAAGYTAVYVTLKDSDGYLRYSTAIDGVKGGELVTGTLPLQQIAGMIKGAGLTPVAVMGTVLDSMTPAFVDDTAYRFEDDSYTWLDARVEEGGKRWVDPFKAGTTTYFNELADEISSAGFKTIVLTGTLFPEFRPYDETVLNAHFFTDDRYKALSALVSSMAQTAANNGSEVVLEVKLKDVLSAADGAFTGTAELLRDKDVLAGTKIIVVFNDGDFEDEITAGTDVYNVSTDTEGYIKTLFEPAEKLLAGYGTAPCLNSEGYSSATLGKMQEALRTMGFDEIVVK